MSNNRERKNITRTPAPFLPGCYSVQAISLSSEVPDVTTYHLDHGSALKKKDSLSRRSGYKWFLIRGALDAWDVYDGSGKLDSLCSDVVYDQVTEVEGHLKVDRVAFEDAAKDALGNGYSCLVGVECHSNSSSADHSNFVVLMRTMLMGASEKDLAHIAVVESRNYDCRVVGLFADVSKLSMDQANHYLDRYQWLKNSWPLNNSHHLQILAFRWAQSPYKLGELVGKAFELNGADEEEQMAVKASVVLCGFDKRRHFADGVLATIGLDGLVFRGPGAAEQIRLAAVESHCGKIIDVFNSTVAP